MTEPTSRVGGTIRSLAGLEEFAWTWSFRDSMNASMAAHIEGRTSVEAWRRALNDMQTRHVLLSASVEVPNTNPARDGRPWFCRRPAAGIPLQTIPWTPGMRWEAELERELAHPFTWGAHPLIRATLLHSEDRCILILSASHIIVDGLSFLIIIRDLLSMLAGKALAAPPAPCSVEEALGVDPLRRAPMSKERIAKGQVPRRAGIPIVSTCTVPEDVMSGLLHACRRHDCTFNGALVAATAQAMRRMTPEWRDKPIRVLMPVNIRDIVDAGECCGVYAATATVSLAAGNPGVFWKTAREVRNSAVAAATRENLLSMVERLRALFAEGMTTGELMRLVEHDAGREIIVTNLGRVTYGATFGPLTLTALYPAVPNILPPFHTVAAVTLNGSLCLTFSSRCPIPRFLEGIVDALVENCRV